MRSTSFSQYGRLIHNSPLLIVFLSYSVDWIIFGFGQLTGVRLFDGITLAFIKLSYELFSNILLDLVIYLENN